MFSFHSIIPPRPRRKAGGGIFFITRDLPHTHFIEGLSALRPYGTVPECVSSAPMAGIGT